jgi:hypothetical protein
MAPLFQQPFMSGGFPSMNRAVEAGVGGWVELGRTTLGSTGDNITVSSLPDKRYYMVLYSLLPSGQKFGSVRLGNGSVDTGSNYAIRWANNGGSDSTSAPISYCGRVGGDASTTDQLAPSFGVGYFANYSSKEKLAIHHAVGAESSGAGSAPQRGESVGKWANTSNPIDVIESTNLGGGDYASGSEVVVLGFDPLDSHTNNFWEELASVEADGTSTDMSSGTITAKKYLWIQLYQKGRAGDVRLRFNSDSGYNYNRRYSQNGASDGTDTSVQHISNMIGIGTTPSFGNAFIINVSSKEKLVMGHHISQQTAGAGTAPQRMEFVAKWANTSNQITNVNILSSSGNFPSGSIFKVWGAD